MSNDDKLILPAREGYDRWASTYDNKGNPTVALKQREIRRLLGDIKGLQVVDLGCGDGRVVLDVCRAFPAQRAVGIDLQAVLIDRARSQSKQQQLSDTRAVRPTRWT